MSDQVSLHTERLPANHALGTRAGAGRYAAPPRPYSRGWATTTADRRAHIRNAEGVDGLDPFLDQDVAASPNGNEPAGPGVQPKTGAKHLWNATVGCIHEGVGPPVATGHLRFANHPPRPCGGISRREPLVATRFHTASVELGHPCTKNRAPKMARRREPKCEGLADVGVVLNSLRWVKIL